MVQRNNSPGINVINKRASLLLACFLVLASFGSGWSSTSSKDLPEDLSTLSIEELKGIKLSRVMSVSKREENLFEAPSAVYVIESEDIRRSGYTSIPELLRLVPGMEVARIDGNKWAITARGFNGRGAIKLRVLLDGRNFYSQVFSGTFWDTIDYPIDDIERIEVVRGPGGTLWGANAVNGVVNIITKKASKTLGGRVTGGTGNLEKGIGDARYGVQINEKTSMRVYGKYFKRDGLETPAGDESQDDWQEGRVGFRAEIDSSQDDKFTVEGEFYKGKSRQTAPAMIQSIIPLVVSDLSEEEHFSGGHFLTKWAHEVSETSSFQLQMYYLRESRSNLSYQPDFYVDTFDLDFQHNFALGSRHELLWGSGLKYTFDQFENTFNFSFSDTRRTHYLIGGFIQDKIALIKDELHFTIGSKISVNSFTGLELQPSARLAWKINDNNFLWGAVSRAVSTPSRLFDNAQFRDSVVAPGPTILTAFGDSQLESENLLSFELGYRAKLSRNTFFEIDTFYNEYDDLGGVLLGAPTLVLTPAPHVQLPGTFVNVAEATSFGVEVSGIWQVMKNWKLEGSFNWTKIDLETPGPLFDLPGTEGTSPRYQWKLNSQVDLPYDLEWDTHVYRIGSLSSQRTPSYTRVDTRVGWRPSDALDVSLGAQNIFEDSHFEFGPVNNFERIVSSKVPRSFLLKVTLKY